MKFLIVPTNYQTLHKQISKFPPKSLNSPSYAVWGSTLSNNKQSLKGGYIKPEYLVDSNKLQVTSNTFKGLIKAFVDIYNLPLNFKTSKFEETDVLLIFKSPYIKPIKADSWFKALKALKPIGVPIVFGKGMKIGTTYTITVKRFSTEFLINNPLVVDIPIAEEKIEKPNFKTAANLYEELPNEKAKKTLETYARRFGVELKRSNSFANMLKDFKGQYDGE